MARSNTVTYLLGTKFYKMAYVEFGNPAAPAVLCVHGLTRTGRDFDPLAEALSDQFHVICPDLPGRGQSEWLGEAMAYQPPTYVVALAHLLAVLNKPVTWVGTSLGGICGMMVAAAQNAPVRTGVERCRTVHSGGGAERLIRDYMLGVPERFPTMQALEAHLRRCTRRSEARRCRMGVSGAPFRTHRIGAGPGKCVRVGLRPENRRAAARHDAVGCRSLAGLGGIKVPVLTICARRSDLLLPETLERMKKEGSKTYTVPDAGMAPALMDADFIGAIGSFCFRSEEDTASRLGRRRARRRSGHENGGDQ